MSYEELLLALPRLSKVQLADVRQRCIYLLQRGVIVEPEPIEEEDWLLLGLMSELARRGIESRQFKIKKPTSYASFQTQSERARMLLLQAAPGLTATQRRALGELCGYELGQYMEGWYYPMEVNRDNLLRNVGKVTAAIDHAYPGYMEAQMLGLVIRELMVPE